MLSTSYRAISDLKLVFHHGSLKDYVNDSASASPYSPMELHSMRIITPNKNNLVVIFLDWFAIPSRFVLVSSVPQTLSED